jgi:hypothetical protein
MHHVASAPPTEIVLLAVTVMNVLLTTVESVPNVLPTVSVLSVLALTAMHVAATVPRMVTVTNVLHITVVSAPSAHRMETATIVLHVTSAETVLVTTRTKLHVVPLLTSTLQRTRRHASHLRRMSYLSASKHRQPLLQMLMA